MRSVLVLGQKFLGLAKTAWRWHGLWGRKNDEVLFPSKPSLCGHRRAEAICTFVWSVYKEINEIIHKIMKIQDENHIKFEDTLLLKM